VLEVEFSKKSRKAIIIFAFLLVFISFIPRVIVYFSEPQDLVIKIHERKILEELNSTKSSLSKKESKYKIPPTKFDPNYYSAEQWMNLGLSKKQANSILKFARYGLKSNKDLQKIFVLPSELFLLIKDSTFYSNNEFEKDKNKTVFVSSNSITKEVININNADEKTLISLKGIGPFYAKNIIRKRDELGGFYSINQLYEVWKMDSITVSILEPQILIQEFDIQKIQLNKVTFEELKKHPYLSWNLANSIIKLRKNLGEFKSIEDIKKSVLMTNVIFEKIKPYLEL
jgi:competence protein ComEA